MSLWLSEIPPQRAPLEEDRRADVAVIGGGIAGVSLAYALASEGASVALVEARHVAAAASGRNAGFILAGVAENFVVASRRYGEQVASRIWDFTRRNQERIRMLVARHGIACDLAWNGSLQLAGDDVEWNEIRESVRRLAARGARASLDANRRAACYAEDGEFHPALFVRALAAAAEERGARLYEGTRAVAVTTSEVRTDGGTIRAGAVALCANAYTAGLVPTRIRPIRGQMLATAPHGTRLFPQPTYANRGYRYWRQTREGRILVGGWRDLAAEEEIGEEEHTTTRIQTALDAFLAEHRIDAPVAHRWAGIMGFSHDALPYVGRTGAGPYICGGFTGHGNAFAVEAAALLCVLLRGDAHPDADLFDPDRT